MRPTRRLPAALAATALALTAACGGQDGGSTAGDEKTGDATRTVKHAMGTTKVPQDPKRVVVLDTGELDTVTALGVKPVGAVKAPVDSGFLGYLKDETKGVEMVGDITEPNLEAVAKLQPDLILSSKIRHEKLYDELSGIAPTVFTETVGVTWKENFLLHAEALGRKAEARRQLDAYEKRAAALGRRIGEARGTKPGDLEVSLVRFLPDEIRLYQRGSFIGTILDDMGLGRPATQRDPDETFLPASQENVDRGDGDVLFYSAYGPEGDTPLSQVTSSGLWKSLDAVKSGDAYRVDDDHWMTGIGIQAANRVLDDMEKQLLGG
jgi:iron complex transport system substrate-binding protein